MAGIPSQGPEPRKYLLSHSVADNLNYWPSVCERQSHKSLRGNTDQMVRLSSFVASLVALAAAATSALASDEASFQKRIVFSPKIVYPTASTQWKVGQRVNVTWDVSHLPKQLKNATGTIRLGHIGSGDSNEHLANTLANNFLLRTGNVTFTVPKVERRDDYVVVLFGDSGNHSPKFSIH